MSHMLLTLMTGLSAGFVNGLLGTGGGIILIFMMKYINKNISVKDTFASTLSVTLVLSVVSAIMYCEKGNLPTEQSVRYIIPACIGGCIGAFLLDRMNTGLLKKIFCAIIIISGLNMIDIF